MDFSKGENLRLLLDALKLIAEKSWTEPAYLNKYPLLVVRASAACGGHITMGEVKELYHKLMEAGITRLPFEAMVAEDLLKILAPAEISEKAA